MSWEIQGLGTKKWAAQAALFLSAISGYYPSSRRDTTSKMRQTFFGRQISKNPREAGF
jgi:hypothetical protein